MRPEERSQLATESVGSISRRELVLTLLVPPIVFILANLAMSGLVARYPLNATYVFMREKWLDLLRDEVNADFLILGDSSALHGIEPETLDRALGVHSTNLGAVGGLLALNDSWMLGAYIERNGAPKGALIVHVIDMWNRPMETVPFAKLPLPWRYWRKPPTDYPLPASDVLEMGVVRYLPLSTDNQTVAQYVMYPWRDQYSRLEARMRATLHRGFWGLPAGPEVARVVGDAADQARFLKSRPASLSAPNRYGLDRIGELTERYGFDAYLALSPVYDGLAETDTFKTHWARTAIEIEAAIARYPRFHLMTTVHAVPAGNLTNTVDHVSVPAARAFTTSIAGEIQERWARTQERGPSQAPR
jgi:hypothetical protein